MKTRIQAFLLLLFSLNLTVKAFAQGSEFKNDISISIKKFNEKRFKANIKYQFFNSYLSKTPLEEKNLITTIWGNYLFYQLGSILNIVNKNYNLVIDFDQKIVLLNKNNISQKPNKYVENINEIYSLMLDSMSSKYYNITQIENYNYLQYRLKYKAGNKIDYLDVYLHKGNKLLYKIEVFYLQNMSTLFGYPKGNYKTEIDMKSRPKLSIIYENIVYLDKFNEKDFSIGKFVNISGKGAISLTDSYKDFKLENYTNLKKIKKKKATRSSKKLVEN